LYYNAFVGILLNLLHEYVQGMKVTKITPIRIQCGMLELM